MGAPGFYGHLVVTLDVIFSRGRSKKREQRQFIKVLRFFCVNLFPGSRVWQCCCSRLGHLALRHYKPICLVFMIFAQYFHFVYFFSQEITGYNGKLEGRGWIRIAMCWSWWLIFPESPPFNTNPCMLGRPRFTCWRFRRFAM